MAAETSAGSSMLGSFPLSADSDPLLFIDVVIRAMRGTGSMIGSLHRRLGHAVSLNRFLDLPMAFGLCGVLLVKIPWPTEPEYGRSRAPVSPDPAILTTRTKRTICWRVALEVGYTTLTILRASGSLIKLRLERRDNRR